MAVVEVAGGRREVAGGRRAEGSGEGWEVAGGRRAEGSGEVGDGAGVRAELVRVCGLGEREAACLFRAWAGPPRRGLGLVRGCACGLHVGRRAFFSGMSSLAPVLRASNCTSHACRKWKVTKKDSLASLPTA